MQKLREAPDRKRDDACRKKKGTISARERILFSFSSYQQSDNT